MPKKTKKYFKKKPKYFKKKTKHFKKRYKKRRTIKKKKVGGYFFKKNNPLVFDMPWKYPTTTWFAIAKKGSETRHDDNISFFPTMENDIKIINKDCNCDKTDEASNDTTEETESFDKSKFYNSSEFKFLKHPINSWFIVSKDGAKQRRLNANMDNDDNCECEEESPENTPPEKEKGKKEKGKKEKNKSKKSKK